MKGKRAVIAILAVALCIALPGCKKTTVQLTGDYLVKKEFAYTFALGACAIRFLPGNAYEATYGSEGISWFDTGTYRLENNTAYLTPSACRAHRGGDVIKCAESLGEAVCSVEDTPGDIHYEKYLKCTSKNNRQLLTTAEKNDTVRFPFADFSVRAGTAKVWKGTPVVTMGMKKGTTTVNVRMREKPSVSAKTINYFPELFNPDVKEMPSIPKGTGVVVIARTKDKQKVEKWDNYWYLINAGAHTEVWAYGEFIAIK